MLTSTALAAALLLTQNAQQFDLMCTGTIESGSNLTATVSEPISERYRIDLTRMVWCTDECGSATAIKEANSASILLQQVESRDGLEMVTRINRTNGTLISNLTTQVGRNRIFVRTNSACTRSDYTPIPAAQF